MFHSHQPLPLFQIEESVGNVDSVTFDYDSQNNIQATYYGFNAIKSVITFRCSSASISEFKMAENSYISKFHEGLLISKDACLQFSTAAKVSPSLCVALLVAIALLSF